MTITRYRMQAAWTFASSSCGSDALSLKYGVARHRRFLRRRCLTPHIFMSSHAQKTREGPKHLIPLIWIFIIPAVCFNSNIDLPCKCPDNRPPAQTDPESGNASLKSSSPLMPGRMDPDDRLVMPFRCSPASIRRPALRPNQEGRSPAERSSLRPSSGA